MAQQEVWLMRDEMLVCIKAALPLEIPTLKTLTSRRNKRLDGELI